MSKREEREELLNAGYTDEEVANELGENWDEYWENTPHNLGNNED